MWSLIKNLFGTKPQPTMTVKSKTKVSVASLQEGDVIQIPLNDERNPTDRYNIPYYFKLHWKNQRFHPQDFILMPLVDYSVAAVQINRKEKVAFLNLSNGVGNVRIKTTLTAKVLK